MRINSLILLILCLNNICYAQKMTVSVHNDLIDEYILGFSCQNSTKRAIIIADRPSDTMKITKQDYHRIKAIYKKLKKRTFFDFINKLSQPIRLDEIESSHNEFVLFKQDSIPDAKTLISLYPNWGFSIIEISNVGFNWFKNQAMVYYSHRSILGVGIGALIIFRRHRIRDRDYNYYWRSETNIAIWVSE